jgi:Intracellular proteinase inhibitor
MLFKKMAMLVLAAGWLCACGTGNNANGNGEGVKKENLTENPNQNGIAVQFHPSIEIKEENNSVIINYKVKNLSGEPQKLSFPNGLQADFIVYDEKGLKVKQYSEEVMSSQAITEVTLENNQEIQNSFTISDLYNGSYRIEVFLTAAEEEAKVVTDLLVENSVYTKASGILVGQMDPHTIEVDVKGEKVAFQLTEEAMRQLSSLKDGSEISFVYTENEIQKTIEKFLVETK